MRRYLPSIAVAAVFALALGVYAATAARTVTLADNGELILVATELGVAHPPGFPVWVLLGHLAGRLPLGSLAHRVALLSGLAAAVVAVLAALAVAELLRATAPLPPAATKRKRRDRGPEPGAWIEPALPTLTGLAAAFSLTLWTWAVVAEVYTLSLAFVATALVLVLGWRRRLRDDAAPGPLLPLAGLAFGLALGIHHVTAVLALPALAAPALAAARLGALLRRRDLHLAAAAVAVALLAYVQLPLSAASEPLIAWGEPTSWGRFVDHLTGKQYRTYFFAGWEATGRNLAESGRLFLRQLGPLGILLAIAGGVRLAYRDRAVLVGFLLAALATVGYSAFYDIAEDADAYLVFPFLTLAVAAGLGFRQTAAWLGERRVARVGAVLLAAALPLVPLATNWKEADRRDFQVARRLVEDVLASVGPGGVVLTRDWQLYAAWLYLHHLEGFRPDAVVVDVNLVRRSWYLDGYLVRAYPELMESVDRERDSFLALLKRWEDGLNPDGAELTRRFVALQDAMLAWGLARGDAHITLPSEPGVARGLSFEPVGLTVRLNRSPPLLPTTAPPLDVSHLRDLHDPVAIQKVRPFYAMMLAARGRHLTQAGRRTEGDELLRVAHELDPVRIPAP